MDALSSSRGRWEGDRRGAFKDQRRHGPEHGFVDFSCGGNELWHTSATNKAVAQRDVAGHARKLSFGSEIRETSPHIWTTCLSTPLTPLASSLESASTLWKGNWLCSQCYSREYCCGSPRRHHADTFLSNEMPPVRTQPWSNLLRSNHLLPQAASHRLQP